MRCLVHRQTVHALDLPRGRGRAIFSRRILPATSGHERLQNALNGAEVIRAWTTRRGKERQEWLDEGPLPVREMISGHAAMLIHPVSVSEPPLNRVANAPLDFDVTSMLHPLLASHRDLVNREPFGAQVNRPVEREGILP